jgi:hypothetical protein
MLEAYTLTITNLNISLETATVQVQGLEESLQVQQKNLKQAITSPSLLRHTPLKNKGSGVKEKVEAYENNLFNMTLSPSTRK